MAEAQTFTLDLPSISQLGNGKTQFGTRSFDLKSSHSYICLASKRPNEYY